ncbi:hypothetical protein A9Q74_06160 [Colwellia sp. 39_35_sub15_T18]|nr:hypothetical protein A9Q74_06160 [Colwellia sp. 39_35_sub15_T18]
MSLVEFGEKFPIGTKVKYFPLATNSYFEESEIASEPWLLGHGEVVVKLKGKSGCYGTEHIELNEEVAA